MSRCFGQYVQQQLSVNKRLYNSLDRLSPWAEFLLSQYLFLSHTATRHLYLIARKSIDKCSYKCTSMYLMCMYDAAQMLDIRLISALTYVMNHKTTNCQRCNPDMGKWQNRQTKYEEDNVSHLVSCLRMKCVQIIWITITNGKWRSFKCYK